MALEDGGGAVVALKNSCGTAALGGGHQKPDFRQS
jgi:hypothetical protein